MMQARLSKRSLRFIKRRIEFLKNTDLKKASIEYLKEYLFDLLEPYTSATISVGDNTSVFRARKNNGNALFESVNELWYPPRSIIKQYGRANNIGQTLFYCAADEAIAILELRPAINDIITILECKFTSSKTPILIPLGIYELTKEYGVKIAGPSIDHECEIKSWLNNNESNYKKNSLIGKFITDEFKKVINQGNDDEYKMIVAISELLFSFEGIDGITYPSIASGLINANLALLPQAVDSMCKPVACQVVKVIEQTGDSTFKVAGQKAKAIESSGRIEW